MILNIGDCARRKLALARSSSVIPNRKVRCWRSQIDTNRSQRVPWSEWEKLGSGRQLRQYDAVVPLAENDGFDYDTAERGPSALVIGAARKNPSIDSVWSFYGVR